MSVRPVDPLCIATARPSGARRSDAAEFAAIALAALVFRRRYAAAARVSVPVGKRGDRAASQPEHLYCPLPSGFAREKAPPTPVPQRPSATNGKD